MRDFWRWWTVLLPDYVVVTQCVCQNSQTCMLNRVKYNIINKWGGVWGSFVENPWTIFSQHIWINECSEVSSTTPLLYYLVHQHLCLPDPKEENLSNKGKVSNINHSFSFLSFISWNLHLLPFVLSLISLIKFWNLNQKTLKGEKWKGRRQHINSK